MRVKKDSLQVRTVSVEDYCTLERWAEYCRPLWGEDVLDEIRRAEYRVAAYLPELELPIGFASITPNGSPDGFDRGEMWFDHLFVDPNYRGGVQEVLYDLGQIPYARGQSGRRILRVPLSDPVVRFSTKRGWKKKRDLPGTPFINGVYELPREALTL